MRDLRDEVTIILTSLNLLTIFGDTSDIYDTCVLKPRLSVLLCCKVCMFSATIYSI